MFMNPAELQGFLRGDQRAAQRQAVAAVDRIDAATEEAERRYIEQQQAERRRAAQEEADRLQAAQRAAQQAAQQ